MSHAGGMVTPTGAHSTSSSSSTSSLQSPASSLNPSPTVSAPVTPHGVPRTALRQKNMIEWSPEVINYLNLMKSKSYHVDAFLHAVRGLLEDEECYAHLTLPGQQKVPLVEEAPPTLQQAHGANSFGHLLPHAMASIPQPVDALYTRATSSAPDFRTNPNDFMRMLQAAAQFSSGGAHSGMTAPEAAAFLHALSTAPHMLPAPSQTPASDPLNMLDAQLLSLGAYPSMVSTLSQGTQLPFFDSQAPQAQTPVSQQQSDDWDTIVNFHAKQQR